MDPSAILVEEFCISTIALSSGDAFEALVCSSHACSEVIVTTQFGLTIEFKFTRMLYRVIFVRSALEWNPQISSHESFCQPKKKVGEH